MLFSFRHSIAEYWSFLRSTASLQKDNKSNLNKISKLITQKTVVFICLVPLSSRGSKESTSNLADIVQDEKCTEKKEENKTKTINNIKTIKSTSIETINPKENIIIKLSYNITSNIKVVS